MKNRWTMLRTLSLLTCAAALPLGGGAAPIAIGSTQALGFGGFVANAGGLLTISPAGIRSTTGAVLLLPSMGGSAAQFSVSGDAGMSYAITLPPDGTVSLASGANTMAVNGFSSSPGPTGQLGLGGTQTLAVGARLSVGANQPPGSYSGSFQITVDYN